MNVLTTIPPDSFKQISDYLSPLDRAFYSSLRHIFGSLIVASHVVFPLIRNLCGLESSLLVFFLYLQTAAYNRVKDGLFTPILRLGISAYGSRMTIKELRTWGISCSQNQYSMRMSRGVDVVLS